MTTDLSTSLPTEPIPPHPTVTPSSSPSASPRASDNTKNHIHVHMEETEEMHNVDHDSEESSEEEVEMEHKNEDIDDSSPSPESGFEHVASSAETVVSPSQTDMVKLDNGVIRYGLAIIFLVAGFIVAALYGVMVASFYLVNDYYQSRTDVITPAMLFIVRSAYYAGYLIGAPIALLCLRPITAVLAGCSLTTVAALFRLSAFSPAIFSGDSILLSYSFLVIALFCTGLGYSFMTAYMMSIVESLVPYRWRALALGAVTATGYLGFVIFNMWSIDLIQSIEDLETHGHVVATPCAIVIAADLLFLILIMGSRKRYRTLMDIFQNQETHLERGHRSLPISFSKSSMATATAVASRVRSQLERLRSSLGSDSRNRRVAAAYLLGYGVSCALIEITSHYLLYFAQIKDVKESDMVLVFMLYLLPGNIMPLINGWIIDRRHNWRWMIWLTTFQQAASILLFLYMEWGLLGQVAIAWHSMSVTYESLFATYLSELVYPAKADAVVNIMWWTDVLGSGMSTFIHVSGWSLGEIQFFMGCCYAALAAYFSIVSLVFDPILYRFVE